MRGDNTNVPGHERDCDCYLCNAARSVPEAICPEAFAIRRSRQHPVYVIEFIRSDTDENVRVMLTPAMLASMGGHAIEHTMQDCANTFTQGSWADGPGWELAD